MTRDDIAALLAKRHHAFDRHDAEAAAALYAPDTIVESPLGGGTVRGREANAQVLRTLFTAFPDVTFSVEEMLIDGAHAAIRLTMTGTDEGGFMGMPPTHKPFQLPMMSLCQVRDGLIVHERRIYDFTGMLIQIGVLRAKPA